MGALSHIRVLDLSRVLAAPFATQILGDLGAEVIKVEKPGEGDETRAFGPPFLKSASGARGDATYFLTANRNKKSAAIDFSKSEGAALVRKLARRAHEGKQPVEVDEKYLSAMEEGFPSGAGMALGFDRLVMVLTDCADIASVLAFNWDEL